MPYEQGAAGVVVYLEEESKQRPAELAIQLGKVMTVGHVCSQALITAMMSTKNILCAWLCVLSVICVVQP